MSFASVITASDHGIAAYKVYYHVEVQVGIGCILQWHDPKEKSLLKVV